MSLAQQPCLSALPPHLPCLPQRVLGAHPPRPWTLLQWARSIPPPPNPYDIVRGQVPPPTHRVVHHSKCSQTMPAGRCREQRERMSTNAKSTAYFVVFGLGRGTLGGHTAVSHHIKTLVVVPNVFECCRGGEGAQTGPDDHHPTSKKGTGGRRPRALNIFCM